MVRKSNDPKFFSTEIVDDAMAEPPQRKAPSPVSPFGTNSWMITKERNNPLELSDKGATKFGATFASIVDGPFGQFPFNLGSDSMESFDRCASSRYSFRDGNELRAAALDFFDSAFNLDSPSLLDLMILKKARD